VADRLRDKIIRAEIPQGEQLHQGLIASEFEVSRIPVREALHRLESEGLVTIVPHRGAVVSSLSPDDIGELFDLRALLECAVLKLCIPRLTETDFVRAEVVLKEWEEALLRPDISAWGHLNWEFHCALYSCANRPHFMSIIRNIYNRCGGCFAGLQLYLTREFERAKEEHRQLLDLCRVRDTTAACDLLLRHISHSGESLIRVLGVWRAQAKQGAYSTR
jgi:DNA-binding GntR family transcriptional regulator